MPLLVLIFIVFLVFGSCGYLGYRRKYYGGRRFGLFTFVLLVLFLFAYFGVPQMGNTF